MSNRKKTKKGSPEQTAHRSQRFITITQLLLLICVAFLVWIYSHSIIIALIFSVAVFFGFREAKRIIAHALNNRKKVNREKTN
jgi:fatty acid desaturase